ncbi:MAG TPA: glycosyltransferase [Cytophagaceae bacterium]|nr:glycosyltransferase [Cytophagaceae bacterium]
MTRTKIVIASVLKPVYEPRMYEKIGITLSKNPLLDVHVVGYGNVNETPAMAMKATGLGLFKRLSLKRLLAPWKIFRLLNQQKPAIAIACTHELLFPFVLHALLHPSVRLVYDVQENYYLNILHTHAFPSLLRWPIASWVRLKEKILLPFYSKVISAEQCYLTEMPFIIDKAEVVANKAVIDPFIAEKRDNRVKSERTCLLFSGTVSEEYGIYEAIGLAELLHAADSSFYLRIIGYCANDNERHKLQLFLKNKSFVVCDSLDQPVAHTLILEAIAQADWGMMAYSENKATRDRIPTKLYEYMSYRLPVLSTNNLVWQELITHYDAGLCINYRQTHLDLLTRLLKLTGFYKSNADFNELLWNTEEQKLVSLMNNKY